MRFDINLASKPYEDVGRFYQRWVSALIGLALLTAALCIWSIRDWNSVADINRDIADLNSKIAAIEKTHSQNEAMLNDPSNREIRARADFLNGIIVRRSFSWTRALADLERVLPAGVKVMKIEPSLRGDRQLEIKMTVAGASHEKVLDFIRKLESSSTFTQASLLKEYVGTGQDPDAAYEADLVANYIAPTGSVKPQATKETEGD